jgi:hypothetical protein
MKFETLWNNFPEKEQIKIQYTNKQKDINTLMITLQSCSVNVLFAQVLT